MNPRSGFADALLSYLTMYCIAWQFFPAVRRNWRYRFCYWRESRRPGFDPDEHVAREYPTLAPMLEGFTSKVATSRVEAIRGISCYCRCEAATRAVEALSSPYGSAWEDDRDFRESLASDAEKFLGRWR